MKDIIQKLKDSDIGVWLSVAVAVGYGLYYMYATSFNQYYGLPEGFVELKIENLALVIVLVVLAIGFLGVIPELFRFIFENNPKKEMFKKVLGITFALIITIVGVLSLFGLELPRYSLEMISLILILFVTTYWRLDKELTLRLTISLCILLVGGFSVMFGSFSAAEKESYLIMDSRNNQSSTNNQSFVVIKTFQDKFIIAPVNLQKKEITPKYQFIEIKSDRDNKVEFTLIHTGKLKLQKLTVKEQNIDR